MELILPITILFALTIFSLLLLSYSRVTSVKSGKVKAGYFKVYQNTGDLPLPEKMMRYSRHYNNLLELPILFYVGCLIAMQFQVAGLVEVWAWFFVLARDLLSIVHLTSNHIILRMLSFSLNIISLCGLWITLIGNLFL
jgi:hypothetical protein